jgi:hypothetical protein
MSTVRSASRVWPATINFGGCRVEQAGRMPIYHCYFLDGDDRIAAVEDIDADALPEAVDRAQAMLHRRAHHRTVEVWQGTRRLYATEGTGPRPARYVRDY